jgi:hypothetical protein
VVSTLVETLGAVQARRMPTLLLVLVLLLAGCVPGAGRIGSDGIPSADAPFTLTAIDVGQATFPFRGQTARILRFR